MIVISLQFPNDTIRSHFPFRVYGHGSYSSYPHHNPYPLCSFAASSRSYESFISSLTSSVISLSHTPNTDYFPFSSDHNVKEDEDDDDNCQNIQTNTSSPPDDFQNKISFSICDLDTICIMSFIGIQLSLSPAIIDQATLLSEGVIGSVESGSTIWVNINFNSSKQFCEMLKFKLIQRECHNDGTRLQVHY